MVDTSGYLLKDDVRNETDRAEAHILQIVRLEYTNLSNQISGLKELMLSISKGADAAATKAETVQAQINSTSNEWRLTLQDFTAKVMPRQDVEQRFNAMDKRLTEIAKQVTERSGTLEGMRQFIPWVFAAAMLVVAIMSWNSGRQPAGPSVVIDRPAATQQLQTK
jgi:Flp pilus assembly protein TadB